MKKIRPKILSETEVITKRGLVLRFRSEHNPVIEKSGLLRLMRKPRRLRMLSSRSIQEARRIGQPVCTPVWRCLFWISFACLSPRFRRKNRYRGLSLCGNTPGIHRFHGEFSEPDRRFSAVAAPGRMQVQRFELFRCLFDVNSECKHA